jgi:hypothetical protein
MTENYRNYSGRYSQPPTRRTQSIKNFFSRTDDNRSSQFAAHRGIESDQESPEREINYNNNSRKNSRGRGRGKAAVTSMNRNSNPHHTDFGRLESKIDSMMQTFDEKFLGALSNITDKHRVLEEKSRKVERAIDSHTRQLNDIQQARLSQKMECQGLTFPHGSDDDYLRKIFVDYLKQLGIRIADHEIYNVYAYDKKMKENTRLVMIIIFCHESVKSRVIKAKLDIKDLNDGVYFSNCLTSYNAGLLMHAKDLMRQNKIFRAFFMGLSVFIVLYEGADKIKIESHDHLDWIIHDSQNQTGSTSKSQKEPIKSSTVVKDTLPPRNSTSGLPPSSNPVSSHFG